MPRRKRRTVEPTDELRYEPRWEQLKLLCICDEQVEYERIRPLVLFGEPVPERARQTGTSERTLYRKTAAFRDRKMESFFASLKAKRRVLPPTIRRAIVDLKAQHPPLNLEEIANICGVLFGRRPDGHTVKAVLEESAIPRKVKRRFERYHEAEDVRESRFAVVTLHREGWADKSIADYMRVDRSTVYRVRKRFEEHGEEGLEDRPVGRPRGVQKVDLKAMVEVRRMQENPELGEFRVQAALEQMGIYLSRRSVGRILATNREAEGLEKPSKGRKTKREMPFEASYRHEIWTSDVRYIEYSLPETGNVYVVAILENYSRAMLASAVTLTQNTNAYLSVLHAAIERHGSPKKIVTDGGGIFRSDRAKAVYRALNIEKEEIERGQAWQSFTETNFNVQRRMADFYFARAESWEELVAEHDLWLERHNTQRHQAHEGREDGRRSPSEVLGPVRVVRYHPVDLERAFFSSRFTRKLDTLGYARFRHWRLYAEEGLARQPVAVWLGNDGLSVEYGGQTLSSYDVSLSEDTKLREVTNPRLFVTRYRTPQLRLFGLDELGEDGWLKALELDEYAARSQNGPESIQGVLFSYLEAL
jgi:putative transposase